MSGINFSSIFLGIQVGFGLAYLGDKIIEAAHIIADKPRTCLENHVLYPRSGS